MTELQNESTAGRRAHGTRGAGARLAEIWADITHAQRRAIELNRPWASGPGRANRAR